MQFTQLLVTRQSESRDIVDVGVKVTLPREMKHKLFL